MSYFDFSKWSQFLNEVRTAQADLGNPDVVWYRGVSDRDYRLVPTLFRYKNARTSEPTLFLKYKQVAGRVLPERKNDWEILFDMQHHYIPTRLLDWTAVLGVAVFFALLSNREADAAVYVLDPARLNDHSDWGSIPMVTDKPDFDYRKIYWEGQPAPTPTYPLAIEAPFQNERILAQQGKFTIHGKQQRPLEELVEGCVRKIILDYDVKPGAREYLSLSGINEFSMFPDIVGLAPYIKAVVGLQPIPEYHKKRPTG